MSNYINSNCINIEILHSYEPLDWVDNITQALIGLSAQSDFFLQLI
jgi:hypothetical protein